jgi:hypothetical protein
MVTAVIKAYQPDDLPLPTRPVVQTDDAVAAISTTDQVQTVHQPRLTFDEWEWSILMRGVYLDWAGERDWMYRGG